MPRALVLVVACLLAGPAPGEVYRWVDDEGQVHYGDSPRGDGAKEQELRDSGPVSSGSESRKRRRRRLLESFEQERREREAEREQAENKERERRRRCAQARDRLRSYREAGALYDLNDDGSRRVLSAEERERASERARAKVERWCE